MSTPTQPAKNSPLEVLLIFLRLGCTSFGGPIAHLGYFRAEFVQRRRWLSETTYAELIALAQTLPGPASSQVGFAVGLLRAGPLGALAAFLGFTLPSAALMITFALTGQALNNPTGQSLLHGLQLVAVGVVAQAVYSMQQTLAPDLKRLLIAAAATATVLFLPTNFATLAAILFGAAIGLALYRPATSPRVPHSSRSSLRDRWEVKNLRRSTAILATTFLLLALPTLYHPTFPLTLFAAFYRTGALVFGGGHVVLPLLEAATVTPHWLTQQQFLAGYGAAQAVPGPLFTFAAYLGATIGITHAHPIAYSLLALAGIFAPGLLAMAAILPFWTHLRTNPTLQSALKGINAAVVGILAAALYRPLLTTTLHSIPDILVALAILLLLTRFKTPPWIIVLTTATLYTLPHLLMTNH